MSVTTTTCAHQAALQRVLAIEPEDHATSSRDYGRGFADAIRLVRRAAETTKEFDGQG